MSGDKTMYYVMIAISVCSCLSVVSSLGASFTGNSFILGIQSRIITLFGGPSLEEQAVAACPSSVLDTSKYMDYVTGAEKCPPVNATVVTGSQKTSGTKTSSGMSGTSGTSGTRSGASGTSGS